MAGEIQCTATTAWTLYALVRNSVGSVWSTVGSSFGAYATGSLADYDIALTEQGTASGYYAGTFPAAAAGTYGVTVYRRVGGAPAEGDPVVAAGNIEWTGSVVPSIGVTLPANVAAGASGGLLIAGSNAATTFAGLTTGALSCTTITASGAVAFQSTFAVTTSTSFAAVTCTTFTASGLVKFNDALEVNENSTDGALRITNAGNGPALDLVAGSTTGAFRIINVAGPAILLSPVGSSGYGIQIDSERPGIYITSDDHGIEIAAGGGGFDGVKLTHGGGGVGLRISSMTVTGATTLTGAVSLGSTLGVTGTTTLAALTTTGTVTFNALTVSNATTLTGAVGATNAGNDIRGVTWNAAWDAEVQSEVQDAIEANHLDHLIAVADPGAIVANSSLWAALTSKSATPAYSSYVNTTDSLEAIRDRGDAAWTTATGFSTHSAADIWTVGSRTLTSLSGLTVDTVTTLTNLPTIPANWLTAAGTAADFGTEIAAAVVASTIETGITLKQAVQIIGATTSGKVSGGAASPVFVGLDGSTTRVTGAADASGNRTTATYNV